MIDDNALAPFRTARRPLAVFLNGFGDRILTLPAIRALSAIYDGAMSIVCGVGDREGIYAGVKLQRVAEVCAFGSPGGRWFYSEEVRRLVDWCDCLLVLNPWFSQSTEDAIVHAGRKPTMGLFPRFGYLLCDDRTRHWTDVAFTFPKTIVAQLDVETFSFPPQLNARHTEAAQRLRRAFGEGRRVLAVQTETAPHKSWPAEKFIACLTQFTARHPEYVCIVLDRRPRVQPPEALLAPPDLMLQLALVQAADMFLGVDSCKLHMADLCRIPSVGLFGRGCVPQRFGLRFANGEMLVSDLPVHDIQPGSVLNALESVHSRLDYHMLGGPRK